MCGRVRMRSHVTHCQAWETYSAGKKLMLYRFLDFLNRKFFALILKMKILIKCPSKFCYRYRNFQNTETVTGGVLKHFIKFTGKHLCQSCSNKVAGLSPATLLKKRLRHRCFHVNFVKRFRTPILQATVSLNMKAQI